MKEVRMIVSQSKSINLDSSSIWREYVKKARATYTEPLLLNKERKNFREIWKSDRILEIQVRIMAPLGLRKNTAIFKFDKETAGKIHRDSSKLRTLRGHNLVTLFRSDHCFCYQSSRSTSLFFQSFGGYSSCCSTKRGIDERCWPCVFWFGKRATKKLFLTSWTFLLGKKKHHKKSFSRKKIFFAHSPSVRRSPNVSLQSQWKKRENRR